MKLKLINAIAWLALGLTGCMEVSHWQSVSGSGRIVTENRNVSQFDRVAVGGGGELTITQGDEEALTIEADENLLPFIKSEVSNGRLWIGPHDANLRPSKTIHYQLKVKQLRGLDLAGSLNAAAEQLKADRLELGLSGSGKLQIAKLEANTVSTQVSGSGDIRITGRVNQQRLGVTGSGKYQAADLACQRASVEISGSGHAVIRAEDSLYARISGSGDIGYHGSPKVESHCSGSGRIHPLGR